MNARLQLVEKIDYPTLLLGQHVRAATEARLYADRGDRDLARWYGEQARKRFIEWTQLAAELKAITQRQAAQ